MTTTAPPTCATCGVTYHDPDWITTCDECDEPVCGGCCCTITSEDVVCPACYAAARLAATMLDDDE